MINGGLYNPDNSLNNSVLIPNKELTNVRWHFLQAVDNVATEVRQELVDISSLYTDEIADVIMAERKQRSGNAYDETITAWTILSEQNDHEVISLFREAAMNWGCKYHLVDKDAKNTYFLEIAILWIHMYVQDPKDLPLTEAVYFDAEVSSKELKKMHLHDSLPDGNYYNDFFNEEFPFVFGPPSVPQYYFPVQFSGDSRDLKRDMNGNVLPAPIEEFEGFYRGYNDITDFDKFHSYSPAIRAWNPDKESWSEFEKEIQRRLKLYLKAYKERTEHFLKTSGYQDMARKTDLKHFEWFVRYQVQGWKYEQIRKHYYTSRENVVQRISEMADLIGLPLRPSAGPGRPKKG